MYSSSGSPESVVGRVAGLWRYPVKSMAAESLEQVEVSWHGLAGDRRWAFVRPGLERSGFPWLTIRERPEMRDYRPRFRAPELPDSSPTVVRAPTGEELDVVDPALASRLGDGVRVIKQDVGVFDTMPVSLITRRSVSDLEALTGTELDVQRFRPNLLIDCFEDHPFPEERWVGSTLGVGGALLRVNLRDRRCVVITVDPGTGGRDPEVLRALARAREACLGAYCSTVAPGRIAVGDLVALVG
jgi:uncharacterized protein YcbX